ncbi:MAG: c-type cytochrome [Myxococcales bacterium]|nr:c-type cytochrome [Myxococcales bacterium]
MLFLALTLGLAAPSARWDVLCTPCHGADGRGLGPAAAFMWPRPADLTGPLKLGHSAEAMAAVLDAGVPGTAMPAFGALPAAERAALVAELFTRRAAAPAPDPPPRRLRRTSRTGPTPARRSGSRWAARPATTSGPRSPTPGACPPTGPTSPPAPSRAATPRPRSSRP